MRGAQSCLHPWVECLDVESFEVSDISRDYGHSVDRRRSRDQSVPEWGRIGHMKAGGTSRNIGRDIEDPSFEGGKDTVLQPGSEQMSLLDIATLDQEHAVLELVEGDD